MAQMPQALFVRIQGTLNLVDVEHESLKTETAEKLLRQLQSILLTFTYNEEFQKSLLCYQTEMLLSCVRVSEAQYADVHNTVKSASEALKRTFGTEVGSLIANVGVYIQSNADVNCSSYAMPGGTPYIIINSSALEMMTLQELKAIILHEMGHIVYAHSKYMYSMKVFFDLISVGSALSQVYAESYLKTFNEVRMCFELTADRIMLLCMKEEWPVIRSMCAKFAGGVKGKELSGEEFLKQYEQVDLNLLKAVLEVTVRKNPHPPIPLMVLSEGVMGIFMAITVVESKEIPPLPVSKIKFMLSA